MIWILILLGFGIWWMSGYRHKRILTQIAKELPTTIPVMPLVGHAYLYFGSDEAEAKIAILLTTYALFHQIDNSHLTANHNSIYIAGSVSCPAANLTCRCSHGRRIVIAWNTPPHAYRATSGGFMAVIYRMKALQRFGRDALQQGGTIAYWHGGDLFLAVADPVIADLLLKSCLSKDDVMRFSEILVGNGSLIAPVHIWRPRRKVLSPVFSPKNLNGFSEVFAKQSAKMVELLGPKAGAGEFSIWKYFTTYTFDAVCETNLGVKPNSQEQEDHLFLVAFEKAVTAIAARILQPWLYSEFVYRMMPSYKMCKKQVNYINNFVTEIIKEHRMKLKSNIYNEKKDSYGSEQKSRTLLEMIMPPGKEKGLNDEELIEEVKVIMSAGTDTSAVGACFTLVLVSRYPDVQEAVYKELYEVFGDSAREVNVKDLPHLKYLEMVIKESLRLYPPVPVVVREVLSDVTLPTGTTLVKGISIAMNIWAVHRNRQYWGDDAEHFRPERFLEPLKHPAQFIPFSYGMRNCLGYQYAMMSLKIALASLLRRYRVLPPRELEPERYHAPLRVKFNIMMKDVDNFKVRLDKRH